MAGFLQSRRRAKKKYNKVYSAREERQNVLSQNTPFAVSEAYRSARTNILFTPHKSSSTILCVTSAIPGEGKTINAVNIAISLAQSGKRVVVLDCDMRKPRIHQILRLRQSPGMSEYLAGINEHLVMHDNVSGRGIAVVTSGAMPPNPAELMGSEAMDKLIEALKGEYDYVLIDTPPINIVTDAAVLSKKVDGYLMIARCGYSDENQTDYALSILERVDANVLGFILTDVNAKAGGYGKYAGKKGYSYKRYGYGYGGYGYGGYGYGYGAGEGSKYIKTPRAAQDSAPDAQNAGGDARPV